MFDGLNFLSMNEISCSCLDILARETIIAGTRETIFAGARETTIARKTSYQRIILIAQYFVVSFILLIGINYRFYLGIRAHTVCSIVKGRVFI